MPNKKMKEILEEIQDGWEKQEISHLNTITLANLSEQTAETVEQVVASLLPNRRLWRHVVLLLVCLVEDREMLNQICRPSDVQTLLLNSALLALECPSSLRDNDTIAERLSSVMTDVSACIHRIIQVWTDPVFIYLLLTLISRYIFSYFYSGVYCLCPRLSSLRSITQSGPSSCSFFLWN